MFSKKPEQSPTNGRPRAGGPDRATFSVIAADVVFRGDIEATADLYVDGALEGDVACASLVQGEGGRIDGDITAASARLAGTVVGTINARELVILKTARIEGEVHYEAMTIERGAVVKGRCADDAPDQPATKPKAERKKPQAEILELGKDDEQRLTLAS